MASAKGWSVALVSMLLVVAALLQPARAWCGVSDGWVDIDGKSNFRVDSSHYCRCVVDNAQSDADRALCCATQKEICHRICGFMSTNTDDKCRQHCSAWAEPCVSGVNIDDCFCEGANGTDWGANWDEQRYNLDD